MREKSEKFVVGWREWLHLPQWEVRWVKAKVDTGARTSSLHADQIELFKQGRKQMVQFVVYPGQRSKSRARKVQAPLLEMRSVRSSNGMVEDRPVVETQLDVGGNLWIVEITLTRRDQMGFRMLLGRQALKGRALVDPGRSFVTRKKKPVTKRVG